MEQNPDIRDKQMIKQTFLRPEDQEVSEISPEISAFCLSEDKRLLVIGTAQLEANLIVWEISTNLQLAKLILPNCCIVLQLKIAHDNKHVIIIGLTKDLLQVIMIIDYTTQNVNIFRSIIHSLPYKIKDVAFHPGSTRKFVTCGIQHMCFWHQSGKNLESQLGELVIPKSFSNLGGGVYSHDIQNQGKFGLALVCEDIDLLSVKQKTQDHDVDNIFVTFLSMGFLTTTILTSGDDGFLYMWENERIIRRVFAHEGHIYALAINQKSGVIATGGMEGIVILWRIQVEQKSNVNQEGGRIKSLSKLKMIQISKNVDPSQAVKSPEYNVQSICIDYNRIVIGTRDGSIFEQALAGEQKLIKPNNEKDVIKKWMECLDHEKPKSIAIDMNSSRIYYLTEDGLFSVWELENFNVIFTKNFNKKKSKAIYAFKLSNRVMLVFDNEIIGLDASTNILDQFKELPDFSLKLNTISDAKLNHNEQTLGVATTSAAAPEITLYNVENGLQKLKTFYGFTSSIKHIDFSTDNYYLQCEDNLGEIFFFEIETSRCI